MDVSVGIQSIHQVFPSARVMQATSHVSFHQNVTPVEQIKSTNISVKFDN